MDRTELEAELAALREEVERAKGANELDRRSLWAIVRAIDEEITGRMWLLEGRGSYEWDDDRYRQEFRWAVHALQEKLEPLRKIAHDLTNCPETEKGVDSVRKLEKERDSLRAQLAEAEKEPGETEGCSVAVLKALVRFHKKNSQRLANQLAEMISERDVQRECATYRARTIQKQAAEMTFWVIERFEDGRSVGYWNGASSRSFVSEIDSAVQFRRFQDALPIHCSWHWDDCKITEHMYLASRAAQPEKGGSNGVD